MRNVFFKKVAIIAIAVIAMSLSAVAQQGEMAAGGNLVIGTGDNLTNFGIGGKFQYNVTDPIRLEGSLTLFFPHKEKIMGDEIKNTMWDFSVNGHYLFPVSGQVTVYPLAGLGILGWKSKYSEKGHGSISYSDSDVCLNMGGGVDFNLSDNVIFNAEMKYKIGGNWDRLLFSAGVAFKF